MAERSTDLRVEARHPPHQRRGRTIWVLFWLAGWVSLGCAVALAGDGAYTGQIVGNPAIDTVIWFTAIGGIAWIVGGRKLARCHGVPEGACLGALGVATGSAIIAGLGEAIFGQSSLALTMAFKAALLGGVFGAILGGAIRAVVGWIRIRRGLAPCAGGRQAHAFADEIQARTAARAAPPVGQVLADPTAVSVTRLKPGRAIGAVLLPNGNLLVPAEADDLNTSGRQVEIAPEHPDYWKWLMHAKSAEDPPGRDRIDKRPDEKSTWPMIAAAINIGALLGAGLGGFAGIVLAQLLLFRKMPGDQVGLVRGDPRNGLVLACVVGGVVAGAVALALAAVMLTRLISGVKTRRNGA
jgi:hypothetical protein